MDRTKVITAYLRGFITLKECEQILGIDASFIQTMVQSHRLKSPVSVQQSLNR